MCEPNGMWHDNDISPPPPPQKKLQFIHRAWIFCSIDQTTLLHCVIPLRSSTKTSPMMGPPGSLYYQPKEGTKKGGYRDIPQSLHIFALFDPSKMGNLMIPVTLKEIHISHQARMSKIIMFPTQAVSSLELGTHANKMEMILPIIDLYMSFCVSARNSIASHNIITMMYLYQLYSTVIS